MAGAANEFRIPHPRLIEVIEKALAGAGVPSIVAGVEAAIMAEADLQGVPSHGIRMLPQLLRGIRDGRVHPNPNLQLGRDDFATCVLDGDHGPGRFVSVQAMHHAIDRAKRFGVGVCLATRVSHWGRAHTYACRAAEMGMIGLCTTNAIPNMVAWGSAHPLLGNNPLAIAVPRKDGCDPLVLDIAMSQAAVGKLDTYRREGKKAPENWGLDAAGKPSDDPAAILASGRVLPFGDHKGAGLALMMELLTGALSGGLTSFEIGRTDTTGLDPESSKFFLALDTRVFAGLERFTERVEDLINHLRTSEPGLTITLPGERGWQARKENLAQGIPIHSEIVDELRSAGVMLDASQS